MPLESCLRACQEYFQKIPQDIKHDNQRTEAIEKLQKMNERKREADEQYTVYAYTQLCNMDASTQRSYVSARSSKVSTCSSSRRKRLRQARIDAEQAKFEAQLTFEQDMIEAKAEEERLEAEAKAEAKRLEAEAKQRIQRKEVNFRIAMSHAEASVKRASLEAESDDDLLDTSSMGSAKPITGARKFANVPAGLVKPSTTYGNPYQVTSNKLAMHQVLHAEETPRSDEVGRMSTLGPTVNAFTSIRYNEPDKRSTPEMPVTYLWHQQR
ncbi:unnamed protein product [Clavelina lepadiformis]|uniref:Uncharacterized protein n=1 Tax=Clavelina lepadiformis TaxID=159417 RepID=A0ABP0GT55_CLALP